MIRDVFLILLVASPVDALVQLVLEPVQESGLAFGRANDPIFDCSSSENESECLFLMYVKHPSSADFIECSTQPAPLFNEETTLVPTDELQRVASYPNTPYTECSTSFKVDVSQDSEMSIRFQAPAGKELEIRAQQGIKFEFLAQAVDCADTTPDTTTTTSRENFAAGGGFYVSVDGSESSGLDFRQANSFLQVGQACQTCSPCEIFARVEFGPTEGVRLDHLTLFALYDPVHALSGAHEYRYGTLGYMWIRIKQGSVSLVDAPPTSATTVPSGSQSTPTLHRSTMIISLILAAALGW